MNKEVLPPVKETPVDSDTFRRVWERVMPDQNLSPISVSGPETAAPPESQLSPVPSCPAASAPELPTVPSCPAASAPELPTVPACPAGSVLSPVPVCSCAPCQEETLPPVQTPVQPSVPTCPAAAPAPSCPSCSCGEQPALCLGEASSGESRCLEERISMAQTGMLTAQAIARRASGSCARTMNSLAADHRQAVRRLSAAHFLITGQRFKPSCPAVSLPSTVPLALREQFIWEQRWEQCNHQAAHDTSDPCLEALYQELAQEGAFHAGTIRSLLEQMT